MGRQPGHRSAALVSWRPTVASTVSDGPMRADSAGAAPTMHRVADGRGRHVARGRRVGGAVDAGGAVVAGASGAGSGSAAGPSPAAGGGAAVVVATGRRGR